MLTSSNASTPLTLWFEKFGLKHATARVGYGNAPRSESNSTFGSVPLIKKPQIPRYRKSEMAQAQEPVVVQGARKASIQLHKGPQEVTLFESRAHTVHYEEGEIVEDEDVLMEISDGESPFSDKFSV